MFSKEYIEHYKENFKVAYPVILGQAGHMMASIADSMMVGKISSTQLAACSFANAIFIFIFILAIGISIGITPLVGKAHGAKEEKRIHHLFRHGLVVNLFIGIVTNIVMLLVIPLFDYLGQPPEVITYAKPYYMFIAFSIIPYMVFMSFKSFTDGLEITKPGMIVSFAGNGLNVVLNYFLIFGTFGFPKMELNGAGLATLISRIAMPFLFFAIWMYRPELKKYLNSLKYRVLSKVIIKDILRIGFPIGIQYVLEVGAFVGGTLIIGNLGAKQLAAHHIAINLASLTFLMASGLSSAATIRVSNLIGKKDFINMRRASYSSFVLVMIFMFITASLFFLFGREFALFYVKDEFVINLAVQLLFIAGFFQLVDGAQVNALGNLRGMEDVKFPTYITIFSYWVITLPLCYILAKPFGMGAVGVWWGFCIGLTIAAFILFIRFEIVSRRFLKTNM
jgi:MATE family multidrug resistance protein